jgi:hypothetical protein
MAKSAVLQEFQRLGLLMLKIARRGERHVAIHKPSCGSYPEKRLVPSLDEKWFPANKTNGYHHAGGDALPTTKEVIPYLRKSVPYHASAALGVTRKDVVSKLVVSESRVCTTEIASKLQGKVGEALHSISDSELSTKQTSRSPVQGSLNVAVPSDSDTLCQFCNSIDFKVLGFRKPGFGKDQLFDKRRPLREILQNAQDSKCSFCREVAESFRNSSFRKFDMRALDLENDSNRAHYEMVSLDSARDAPKGHLIRMQVTLKVLSPEHVVYGLPLEFQKICSQHSPPRVEQYCNEGPPSDWGIEEEQAYSGRIRPLVANIELFRKWIMTCCAMHSDPYCGKSTSEHKEERLTFFGLDGLRLIDVKEMCVVDVKGSMDYTALSYVWGEYKLQQSEKLMPKLTSESRSRFREPGSLREVSLPKTIEDAIEVTKSLGYKYIWIDCLCVVQGDETDERYFIPKMDVIFGCAVFTIVAASGDDADAGLPGVRLARSRKQMPFMIKGVSIVRTLDPDQSKERYSSFLGYLKGSVWAQRGWTFQEKLLSPRALIFTEEQVYWECQAGTWCEDGLWETMASPTIYRQCLGSEDYRHPWEDRVERRYRKIVEEYSGRKLKFEKDYRDAFQGIIECFQWDAKRTNIFLWALPKKFLSNALTWHCKELCPERRHQKCRVTSEWGQPIKDCPFPSWSWLGWEAQVGFNALHGRLDAETIDLIFYYFSGSKLLSANQTGATQSLSEMGVRKDGDKTIVSLDDIPKRVDHHLVLEADQSNVLFFWSSTAKLHVRLRPGHIQHHGEYTPLGSFGNDKLILSHKGQGFSAKSWFHMPSDTSHHGELFDFVVIGKSTENRDNRKPCNGEIEKDNTLLAVLLVEWKNGVAYRKGLVHIQLSDWVALDNRVWKLIFLG